MFVRDLLFSCLRRWYFVVVGLIVTGFATYMAFGMVSPTYGAKASVVLIPPTVAVTVGDNPYLYLGGLDQALGVLQVKVTSPEVAEPLLEKYPGATISISKDATTSGPIMAVAVTADSPADTMALLASTMELIPKTLLELQAELKVPALSVIASMPLSLDLKPTKDSKKQIQMTAIAAVGGLAATLLLTGFIDRLMSRKKRAGRDAAETDGQQSFGPRLLVETEAGPEAAIPARATRKPAKSSRSRRQRPAGEGAAEDEEPAEVGT